MDTAYLLCDLIAIQSYSADESKLARFIAKWCDKHAVPYSIYNENVLIQLGDQSAAKRLLFNAHMDVVSGDNWKNDELPDQVSAFDPRVKDGRVYGRGAADTKSGIAAMMVMAERLVTEPELLENIAVDIALTRAEESRVEDNGVVYLCKQGLIKQPTAAVIAEPSNLEVLIGSGGIAQYFFTGKFVQNAGFEYVNPKALQIIAKLRDALPAVDRAVLWCAKQLAEQTAQPTAIAAGNPESSIRPHIATIAEIGETIVCTDAALRGHPAYADYDQQVYRDLMELIPEYVPFDLISAALQMMRYRAARHLDNVSEYFAPLPTFEFTYFSENRFHISCRLSPEVSLMQLRSYVVGFKVKYGLLEDDAREAVFTVPTERIVEVARNAVQDMFAGKQCVSIQRGASDAQLLRSYFPEVPFILLSAGSGVVIDEGSAEKAPTYLSTSHQPNEFVDVGQVEKLSEIYLSIVKGFR